MKIRTVEVTVSRKKSVNYCSTEFSFGMTADLDMDEDEDEVIMALRERLKDHVRAAFKPNTEEGNGG